MYFFGSPKQTVNLISCLLKGMAADENQKIIIYVSLIVRIFCCVDKIFFNICHTHIPQRLFDYIFKVYAHGIMACMTDEGEEEQRRGNEK